MTSYSHPWTVFSTSVTRRSAVKDGPERNCRGWSWPVASILTRPPPMSMTRTFTTWLHPAQNVVRLPSSCSILPIGLYSKVVPDVRSPPQRIPASFTELVPELMNTGDPLSPASTLACTQFWQSNVMLVPDTLVLTHVLVSEPRD